MRIFLLIVTNLAVSMLLGVIFFGLEASGMLPQGQWTNLFVYSMIFGFGGAIVSLLLSKIMAKWSLGVHVIEQPRNENEAWLLETVRQLATRAGVGLPEVGIYESDGPNAFATGWNRNHSLVAVSTGLLDVMRRDQVAAVLGHELAHVANGDMVTLTLLQGVLNTFVMFFARVIGTVVDGALSRNSRENRGRSGGFAYGIVVMIVQAVLGIAASLIVAWFSRYREFRADAGGAALTSPQAMAGALDALRTGHSGGGLPASMTAFGIQAGGISQWFASHPPLEERIARLMKSHS
jgi:heat shock protein HtpX